MRAATFALVVLAACRTQAPSLTTRDVAELSEGSGAVKATLVADPNAPEVRLGPDEQFVPATLDHRNPPPQYPKDLVRLGLPSHRIVARIVFEEQGHVVDVGPSPLERSTQSRYSSQFDAAVCDALLNWRVRAPEVRKFRPGPDSDSDGKPDFRVMTDRKRLKSFFDVAFTFEVVNGEPVVRQGVQ